MTQWLVHVSLISVTEVLVTQWLVHVSFTSAVTEVLVKQWFVVERPFFGGLLLIEIKLNLWRNAVM